MFSTLFSQVLSHFHAKLEKECLGMQERLKTREGLTCKMKQISVIDHINSLVIKVRFPQVVSSNLSSFQMTNSVVLSEVVRLTTTPNDFSSIFSVADIQRCNEKLAVLLKL